MAFDDATEFVRRLHREYLGRLADGEDEDEAMYLTLDGIGDPEDVSMLMWGCGVLFDAMKQPEVYAEIERAVACG